MGWIDLSVKIITYSSVWLQHYEKGYSEMLLLNNPGLKPTP